MTRRRRPAQRDNTAIIKGAVAAFALLSFGSFQLWMIMKVLDTAHKIDTILEALSYFSASPY